MASLQLRGKSYACVFCWHGKRQWFTIGKVTEEEAKAKASQVEYLLMRLKQTAHRPARPASTSSSSSSTTASSPPGIRISRANPRR